MSESPVRQSTSFISYSANFEDVILHRLFGSRAHGLYIDVGAAHPTFDNDTLALYNQGWSGINVEPNPSFFPGLASARPRDRNYQLALSDEAGSLAYWEVAGTGLSTCDPQEAQRAGAKGFAVRETRIECTTLARLLDEVQPAAIDLLKVDVEGFELRVLQGNDWTRFRPSVIVVEATYPETPARRPERLRPFLEQQGYNFVYFDGLNDFFVERSFATPSDAFLPPNVFDRAVPYALSSLREHVANLEHGRDEQDVYVDSLRAHAEALERERAALEAAREQERTTQASVLAAMSREAEALRVECAARNTALAGLRDQAEALEQERSSLALRLDVLQHDAVQTGARLVALDAAVGISRAEAARLRHDAGVMELRGQRDRGEAKQALEATRIQGERLLVLQRELERAALIEHWLHLSVAEQGAAARRSQQQHEVSRLAFAKQQDATLASAARESAMLAAMYASTSWRISRPLRGLARLFGRG